MKKLLYITDQDEYTDHSFIGPLFETYLKKYFTVDIIYFTEFKTDFEKKDNNRFIVPAKYKQSLLKELTNNGLESKNYSYIIVRNDIRILKDVLKEKKIGGYKVCYRLSYPKRRAKLEENIANNKHGIFEAITSKITTGNQSKIINECDIFLPTSKSMQKEFFGDVNIPVFVCPPGMNPNNIRDNVDHDGNEKRFFYAGTLDKLREFETVLEAFCDVKSDNWTLTISTKDPQYAAEMISNYNKLTGKVIIHNAKTKGELLNLIATTDVGVALLPNIPLFNTSTPVKALDYYSSCVPCILTESSHVNTLFTNEHDAWYCKFEKREIQKQLEYIISLSKNDILKVGKNGQQRLLDVRNYEKIAENLARNLENLYA